MARSTFSVDGTALTALPVRWVNDAQKLHGADNIDVAHVTLPGRDGELPLASKRTVGAATWELSMCVTGETYAEFLTNKASLEALLAPARRLVTIREVAGSVDLSAEAMLMTMRVDRPWSSQEDGADLTYSFRVPSGTWRGPTVTSGVLTSGTVVASALAGGSAPQQGAEILFTASSSSRFTIHPEGVPDAYVQWNPVGGAPSGEVVIRSGMYTATAGGANASGAVDYGADAFYVPADGRLVVSGLSSVTNLRIRSRKAWY